MITATDRKIMMLNRIVTQARKKLRDSQYETKILQDTITDQNIKIAKLITLVRGNGAKAPIPAEFQACYDYTLGYVTKNRYFDGTKVSTFKDVSLNNVYHTANELKGNFVVDWLVTRIDEGIYDITFEREWFY